LKGLKGAQGIQADLLAILAAGKKTDFSSFG
jgi:hypothetical protein